MAVSQVLDLGQLDLVSTTSGLELQVSSRAHLAPSAEGVHAPHDTLTIARLTSDTPTRPWIIRASDYTLAIDVLLPDDVAARRHEMLRSMRQALVQAELWEQLGLEPILHQAFEGHEPSGIILALKHINQLPTSELRKQHKLTDGVSAGSLQPPIGVQVVQLRRVSLTLHIKSDVRTKRRRLRPVHSETRGIPGQNHDDMLEVQDELLEFDQELEIREETRTWNTSAISRRVQFGASADESLVPIAYSTRADHGNDSLSTVSSTPKRSYSTSEVPFCYDACSTLEFIGLCDAGLRSIITASPKHLPKSVQVLGHESLKHLADVLPELWAPGYLKTISMRAIMLPTISHALSSVCGVKARSRSLRSKLAELARRIGPHSNENDEYAFGKSASQYQNALGVRLWQALQATVSDNGTSRNLKPFALSKDLAARMSGDDETILEVMDDELTPPGGDLSSDAYDSCQEDDLAERAEETDLVWLAREEDRVEGLCKGKYTSCNRTQLIAARGQRPVSITPDADVAVVEEELLSVCDSVDLLARMEGAS